MIVATDARLTDLWKNPASQTRHGGDQVLAGGTDLQTKDKRECSADQRDHCTETVTSEPDAAVTGWSG
jgi:hypothetical protein